MSIFYRKIGILFLILSIVIINNIVSASNSRPIIGILSQETGNYGDLIKGNRSYIAASYVKFVEGAGARVVPIPINKSKLYYKKLLRNISGVLWPGGAASFKKGYANAGNKIYQIAEEMNQNGTHFPILGICLGFELLAYVASNKRLNRMPCVSQSQALPLKFEKIIQLCNYHIQELRRLHLNNTFRVISQNVATDGVKFISSLEHVNFPFYGLQFHPEKNIYEWIKGKNIPHTFEAIEVGQYFANFFVNEARKNKNRFSNYKEEIESLIYNYPPLYTGGKNNSVFEQIYLFRVDD
ncbi:hypothetical protein M0804_001438 [Polistes exclamans]|nr:hypothetical protein M0804_001438 [Polistes exclamans]